MLPLGIFAFIQLRGRHRSRRRARARSIRWCCCADAAAVRRISFLALRLLLFVLRTAGRADRADEARAHLPGGPPAGALPGHRVRRGAAAAAGDGPAGGLDLLPGDRAAQPRGRRAHAGRAPTGTCRSRRPNRSLAAIGDMPPEDATAVVRTEPTSPTGASRCRRRRSPSIPRTYAEGGWWRSDFSASSLEDILEGLDTEPLGLPIDARNPDARPRRPRPAAGHAGPGHGDRRRRPGATPWKLSCEAGSGSYDLDLDAGRLLSITFHVDTGTDLPPELKIGFRSVELGGPAALDRGLGTDHLARQPGTLEPDGDGGPDHLHVSPGAGNVIGGIWPAPPDLPALISENCGSASERHLRRGRGGPEHDGPPVRHRQPVPQPRAQRAVRRRVRARAPGAPVRDPGSRPHAGRGVGQHAGRSVAGAWRARLHPGHRPGHRADRGTAGAAAAVARRRDELHRGRWPASGSWSSAWRPACTSRCVGATTSSPRCGRWARERAQIRRALVLEQVGLLGFALVAGIAIGYLLLRLMMPYVGTSLGVSYPAAGAGDRLGGARRGGGGDRGRGRDLAGRRDAVPDALVGDGRAAR